MLFRSKNALTPEQTKVAWVESRKLPDTSGENSTVSAAQDSPASKQATDKAVPALTGAAGNLSRNQDDLRESLRKKLDEYEDYELSPEVKAALAAREQKERAEQNAPKVDLELNLFDVVRRKYRERENHMRWGEPLRSTGS